MRTKMLQLHLEPQESISCSCLWEDCSVRDARYGCVFCVHFSNERHLDNVSNMFCSALSENCVIIMVYFHLDFHQKNQRCEEDCLPCFCRFLFHLESVRLQERLNAPRTTFVKDLVFPIVRKRLASHQFRHYRNTTGLSLNCSTVTTRNFCDPQYSTLLLLRPSWIKWIQNLSENFSALCLPNDFINTGLTVSQRCDPSGSRSSWS